MRPIHLIVLCSSLVLTACGSKNTQSSKGGSQSDDDKVSINQGTSSTLLGMDGSPKPHTGSTLFPLGGGKDHSGEDVGHDGSQADHIDITNHFYQPDYLVDQALLRQFDRDTSRDPENNTLPSPRAVSNAVIAQSHDTENVKGLSDLFWSFGQFIDHDIDLSLTDSDKSAPIAIPNDDPIFTGEMGFFRSVTDEQNEQLNNITPYIDGSNIYGSSKELEINLRSEEGGKFILEDNLLPKDDLGMFAAGDIRVNENVALTAMHTLWVREHNRIADELAYKYPDWNDEQLFTAARKIVVAEMQAITFNEFLPLLLGENAINEYEGYDEETSPQVMNAFSTAAYRFGHTMLSSTVLRLDENDEEIPEGNLPLKQAFFAPHKVDEAGIEPIFRGLSYQVAQAVDPLLIDDVRNFLLVDAEDEGRRGFDLASLNLQRGRDHQLPSYNSVRQSLGLDFVGNFYSDVFKDGYAQGLESVYKDPNDIDLWLGGLLEEREGDSLFGPVFTSIIKFQFENLRKGDPSWYENGQFSYQQIEEFNQLKLAHIIKRNTTVDSIQENVLVARAESHDSKRHEAIRSIRVLDDRLNKARSRARVKNNKGHINGF